MKHIFEYLIHGEDIGKRLILGLVALSAALTAAGGHVEGVAAYLALVVAFLVGSSSKAKNGGK